MRLRILVVTAAFLGMGGIGVAHGADGAAVYKANCAKCHGDTGAADSPAAKAMKAPAIAGNAAIAGMADAELISKITENKKHAGLKTVSAEDIAAAAAHTKELAGK